jgi:O-antigen ligase
LKEIASSELLREWWLRAVTVVTMGYVVASQVLIALEGWSRLGFVLAAVLSFLLLLACLLGVARLNLGPWFWIPVLFVGYCLARGLETAGDFPFDALFALISAFLGGLGVAVALQQGMPFKALVAAQVASGLCNVVAGFYGIGNEAAPDVTEIRYAGLTGNANELALQLTLGACLIWLLPRAAGRVACSLALAAVAYALFTTGPRKVLIALPIFLVMVLIQVWTALRGRHRKLFAFAGGVTLCLGGAILAPLVLEHATDITSVRRAVEGDSSYDLRLGMTHEAIKLWHDAPLLGSGTDAFRQLSGYGTYAHNNYAELLCDTGLLGALLFYAIHAYIVCRCLCLRLPGSLKLTCCLFILLLLALDIGSISYNRKQTVMVLMVLASIVASGRVRANFHWRAQQRVFNGGAFSTRRAPLEEVVKKEY